MNIDEPTESTAFNLLYHTAKDYQKKIATLEAENAALRKALQHIATKGGCEVHSEGQIVEYDGKACAYIARQALTTDDATEGEGTK
jgi:hypothetical protein